MFTVHLQQTDYKLRSYILTTGHMEPWVPLLHRVSVRAMEYQLLSVNGRGDDMRTHYLSWFSYIHQQPM